LEENKGERERERTIVERREERKETVAVDRTMEHIIC
jgi:hypothetical protein